LGLIDIHSHVLYGMDDGARTLEDSLAMLRMAQEHGTTAIVATPHANLQYRFDPELISQRLEEVSHALGGTLEIHRGCDFHLSYDNIQDAIANPRKYTINGGPYLLVEFSDLLIFKNTAEIFARLQEAGMIPIITHPERNALLRQRLDQIATWVEAGALNQVTGQSLMGGFGRRAEEFAKLLLERGLVHFLASDGHDCEHRPPRLDEAYAWVQQHFGESTADTLCRLNPRAVLAGEPLELPLQGVSSPPRKWYHIWR
jgi:protein-tyrosine phosphatase